MLSRVQELLDADCDRKVYVDFDYTLFRSNSTEEFLHTGRPAFVATLMLHVLRMIRPWAIGPMRKDSYISRDAIRAWALILLMPWTLLLFKSRSRALFMRHHNAELAAILASVDPNRIVIVSMGFEWLIRQLLRDNRLGSARIVATSFFAPLRLRRSGKLKELRRMGLGPVFDRDLVITDSLDDEDLLQSVDNGFLLEANPEDARGAYEGVYVPFFYTARVKRTPEFVIKQILLEELPVILLATVFFQPFALSAWISATILFVAFFAAYEVGYAENDKFGFAHETRPKLATDYQTFRNFSLEPAAWFWVIGLTIVGVVLLDPAVVAATLERVGFKFEHSVYGDQAALMFLWLGVVLIGRGVFYVFNHLPLVWRIFAYVPLHFVKYFSLVVIFPSQAVGYLLLCSQIIRTWSLYAIRRSGGDMEFMASQTVRLVFLLLLLVSYEVAVDDSTTFQDWHTWIILLWCIVRALPEAKRKLFSEVRTARGSRKRDAAERIDET